ncbi:MAG TPA: TadE/TadG family type IV pilus assembly protein [Chloroflexota bacterium]|nr:TadE/TadG family type IV pilus assembly protein [Chloroflexota bacterium]
MSARQGVAFANTRAGGARGQAFAEFGLVLLLVLALGLLVFVGGWVTANWLAVAQAAREGARAGNRVAATDAAVLDAVNRSASTFTGTFAAVSAATPPDACTGEHAVCVCRHHVNATRCDDTVTPGDQIDVTVRHRLVFAPFAGGWVGQNAAIQLAAVESARIE